MLRFGVAPAAARFNRETEALQHGAALLAL
jgi:hypothetical protein